MNIEAIDWLLEIAPMRGTEAAAKAPGDEEREALALRFGGDLTVPEMAKLLGEPLPRVEGRVYRALKKLREELG